MTVESVASDKTVQPLSVHRLNVPKICRYFCLDEENRAGGDLPNLIRRVVHLYNQTKQEHPYTFIAQHDGLPHFQLLIYTQAIQSQTRLASWVAKLNDAVDLTTQRVSYIFFFYRSVHQNEIYTLTSGQAWRAIQKFTDYHFPAQITRRLFSPEVLSSQNRPLVGGVLTYAEVLKQGTRVSDAAAVDRLFTRIKFGIRPDASLFSFSCFQTAKGEPLQRGMTAEIGLGMVRFSRVLSPQDFPTLLNHFSNIVRGEPTYCFSKTKDEPKEVEEDSEEFDFLDYLHPVDYTLGCQLSKALTHVLYSSVTQGEPFPPLDFCHKRRNDYFQGTNHTIHYKNEGREFSNSFLAAQAVEKLKQFDDLKDAVDEKSFSAELAHVIVKFEFLGKEEEAPFLDCMEGEFRLESGDVYWRLHTIWYEVKADYLGIIHQEFGKMVHRTLIEKKIPLF
jgi:hypothetical protein